MRAKKIIYITHHFRVSRNYNRYCLQMREFTERRTVENWF